MPILQFDDLQAGLFVAIHSLNEVASGYLDGPAELAMVQAQRRKPPVPMGVPIEVLALNPPYVLGAPVLPGGASGGPVFLDTRNVRMMRVPAEVVQVLRERFKPQPSIAQILAAKKDLAPSASIESPDPPAEREVEQEELEGEDD